MRSPAKPIAWLLLVCACAPKVVLGVGTPDVRVVLDVSAAMAQVDSHNMRSSAVAMLLQMLPENANAGVWTFAGRVNVLVEHATTDRLWKQVAGGQLSELPALGQRSNLVEALAWASWDAAIPSDRTRHIVLVARGRVDISDDPALNAAAQDRLLMRLLPQLRDAGFRIHTLAITDDAEVALLKGLSMSTGGTHARVDSADQLRGFFLRVLDNVTMGALLPTSSDGEFRVDAGIREITVLRLRETEDPTLALLDPHGKVMDRSTSRSMISWHKDAGYDLLSLTDPVPGMWRFESKVDDRTRVVALGDLTAQLVGFPGTMFPGGLKMFELYLLSNGRRLRDAEFLRLVHVSAALEGPGVSQPVVVEAGNDGVFNLHLLEVTESGDHLLRVSIIGPTFQRELVRAFTVVNPVTIDVRPSADGAIVWAEVNSAGLDPRSLKVAGKIRQPPAPERFVPAQPMPAGLWKIAVEGTSGSADLTLHISGNYLNNKSFLIKSDPITFAFPVRERAVFALDSDGNQMGSGGAEHLAATAAPRRAGAAPPRPGAGPPLLQAPPPASLAVPGSQTAPTSEDGLEQQLWFWSLVGAVSVLAAAALWWFLKPSIVLTTLPEAVAELTEMVSLATEPA